MDDDGDSEWSIIGSCKTGPKTHSVGCQTEAVQETLRDLIGDLSTRMTLYERLFMPSERVKNALLRTHVPGRSVPVPFMPSRFQQQQP